MFLRDARFEGLRHVSSSVYVVSCENHAYSYLQNGPIDDHDGWTSPPRPESSTARLPPLLLFSFLVCLLYVLICFSALHDSIVFNSQNSLTPIMRLSFALILVFLSSLAAVCAYVFPHSIPTNLVD